MAKTRGGEGTSAGGSNEKKRKRIGVADNKYPLPPDDSAHQIPPASPLVSRATPAAESSRHGTGSTQEPPVHSPQPPQVQNPLTPAHQSALSKFIPPGTPPKEPAYNFDNTYRIMLTRDTEKLMKIKNAKAASPLYPVHDDLRIMEIFNEVNSILRDGNLEFLMWDNPGTYQKLVTEFISTFEVIWASRDGPESCRKAGSKRWAHRWIFQINGYFHTLTEGEFEKIFNYEGKDTSFTNTSTDEDAEFWRYITGINTITFTTNSSSSLIKLPEWKIIHRLVAENLVTRVDKGSRVNHRDLEIMRTLHRGTGNGVQLMTILSDLFEKCLSSSVLPGGSIITLIAKSLGYNLDKGKPLQPNKLSLAKMKHCGMVDKENNWAKEPPASQSSKKKNSDTQAVIADGDVGERLKVLEEGQAEIKGKQAEMDTKLDNIYTILQTIVQRLPAPAASVDVTPAE